MFPLENTWCCSWKSSDAPHQFTVHRISQTVVALTQTRDGWNVPRSKDTLSHWCHNVKPCCLILLGNSHSFMFGFFFLWRGELFTYQIHLHANIFILNILLNVDICMLKCIFIIHYLALQNLLLFVFQTWENVPLQYPFEERCSWVCFWAWFFVWKFRYLLFCFWSSSVCVYKCLSGFLNEVLSVAFYQDMKVFSFLFFLPYVMSFIFFKSNELQ